MTLECTHLCILADGWVGSNDYRTTSRMNFTDNAWHMLTVTTVPGVAEVRTYTIWLLILSMRCSKSAQ